MAAGDGVGYIDADDWEESSVESWNRARKPCKRADHRTNAMTKNRNLPFSSLSQPISF